MRLVTVPSYVMRVELVTGCTTLVSSAALRCVGGDVGDKTGGSADAVPEGITSWEDGKPQC
jgi:hypothetical protein